MIDWPLESDLRRTSAAARGTRERIAPHIRRTPLVQSGGLALKLESLQRAGSFKVRGAAAAITAAHSPREIVAASTGNHGLAVAAIAGELGIPCRVFAPAGAAASKLARLQAAGVAVTLVDGDPLAAELAAREAAATTPGALLVPPYNDPHVILGAASVGLELLEQAQRPPTPCSCRSAAAG